VVAVDGVNVLARLRPRLGRTEMVGVFDGLVSTEPVFGPST